MWDDTDEYPQLQAVIYFRFVNCAVDCNGLYFLMHVMTGVFGRWIAISSAGEDLTFTSIRRRSHTMVKYK